MSLPTTWQTKYGRVLQIKDMSTPHIVNTIRFLERKKGFKEAIAVYWISVSLPPNGEHAQEAFWDEENSAYLALEEQTEFPLGEIYIGLVPTYLALKAELESRGVQDEFNLMPNK